MPLFLDLRLTHQLDLILPLPHPHPSLFHRNCPRRSASNWQIKSDPLLPFTWPPCSLTLVLIFPPRNSFLLIFSHVFGTHSFDPSWLLSFILSLTVDSPFGSTFSFHSSSSLRVVLFTPVFSTMSFPWMTLNSYHQSWPHAWTLLKYCQLFSDISNSSCQKPNSLSPESSLVLGVWQSCWSRGVSGRAEDSFQAAHICILSRPLENSKPGRGKLLIPIPTYLPIFRQFYSHRKQHTK